MHLPKKRHQQRRLARSSGADDKIDATSLENERVSDAETELAF